MAHCLFRSPLSFRLHSFLETRRAANRADCGTQKILIYLDRFLAGELKPGQTITREIAEGWIESMKQLSVGTRINRISILRQFCLYLSHFDPRTCIVHRSFLPHRQRHAPYIYPLAEVRRIVSAARRIGPPGSLRPYVVSTLIGLLHATGLRIGEALNLTLADVDLRRRLIIVRQAKFKKSRNVPFAVSVSSELSSYLRRRRNAGISAAADSPFFPSRSGRKCGQSGIATIFLQVLRRLGIRGPKGQRGPRVHDFRHTFAVNRLTTWYRQGVNLYAKLPLLSTYLGHSTVTGTEIYLNTTAELLERVGKRFHNHFAVPPIRRIKRYDKDKHRRTNS